MAPGIATVAGALVLAGAASGLAGLAAIVSYVLVERPALRLR